MLLRENEAAKILNVSLAWMQRSRWQGNGPPHIKFNNGAVRYRKEDLQEWIDSQVRTSTSEVGGA